MKQEHIRRSFLADICLYMLLLLLMVTLPLQKMATRVVATRVGEEMIVNSMKEYEKREMYLALNRIKLQNLINRLKLSCLSCPLFDISCWVKNLERSYFKMWNSNCSGQQPQQLKVAEKDFDYLAHDPGFLEAYINLGYALKDAGNVKEAIHYNPQCLSLQPSILWLSLILETYIWNGI
ncbi:Tetratricopeptide-like helical [Cynara cardunculus var. scolymus]|uniref:Tetratricopeptide-like helical n=1 Tax=Cynara cardunculus var. scolymus TaxID=59895 RepID=A0A124SDH8_CYNCS|nr:Tetratricopeptide-like helical [Cynara cardunculus var. scolymus]